MFSGFFITYLHRLNDTKQYVFNRLFSESAN